MQCSGIGSQQLMYKVPHHISGAVSHALQLLSGLFISCIPCKDIICYLLPILLQVKKHAMLQDEAEQKRLDLEMEIERIRALEAYQVCLTQLASSSRL